MPEKRFLSECCDHCEHNSLILTNHREAMIAAICELKSGGRLEFEELVYGREDTPENCPFREGNDNGSSRVD